MALRTVGLQAQFNTTQFSQGLNVYLRGLAQVNTVTGRTVKIVNSFNQTFNQFTTNMAKTGSAAARGQAGMQQLGLGATAAAVGIGNLAAVIARDLLGALRRIGQDALEIVVFFERLSLSINFFQARSAQASDSTISFSEALARTKEEARGLLIWVQQLAIASPFTTKQVGTVFRVSQAYGLLAEEAQVLLPLLLDLGAATGLDPQTLENAARALGQIRARGKLTGEEIRQLGNAGIPIRDILVKQLKVTNQEFDKLLEKGAFLSTKVITAIIDSLEDFKGAGEEVAFGTIGGLLSAFQEIKDLGIAKLFGGMLAPLQPLILELVETVNNPQFLAALQIIGGDLGKIIEGAMNRIASAIKGTIAAWNALGPEVQQAVVIFGIAFVAMSILAGVTGLLILLMTKLINPFTIIVTVLSAGLALWTTNAWGARDAMIGFVNAVQGAVKWVADMAQTLGAAVVGLGKFLKSLGLMFALITPLGFIVTHFSDLVAIIRALARVARSAFGTFSATLAGVAVAIVRTFVQGYGQVQTFIHILRALSSTIRIMAGTIPTFLGKIAGAIRDTFVAFINLAIDSFNNLAVAANVFIQYLVNVIRVIFSAASAAGKLSNASVQLGQTLSDMSSNLGRTLTKAAEALPIMQKIVDAFVGLGRMLGRSANSFARWASDVISTMGSVLSAAVDFGSGLISAFADGVAGSVSILESAFEVIGSIIDFWFKPGSPPAIAPNIYRYGVSAMHEFYGGMTKADPSSLFRTISSDLNRTFNTMGEEDVAQPLIDGWMRGMGINVKRVETVLNGVFIDVLDTSVLEERARKAAEALDVSDEAGEIGYNVSQAYLDGLIGGFPTPNRAVDDKIQGLLSQLGGGRQLTRAGAEAITKYVEGFKGADFGAISGVTSVIGSYLGSLVDIGDIKEIDVPRILSSLTENVAKGIQEFRKFGSVSKDTFNAISKAAAPAGAAAVKFVTQYLELAKSTAVVDAAQEKLNQTTEYYKNLLEPLRRELRELEAEASGAGDARELIILRRIANNQLLTEERRREAIAKISLIGKKAEIDKIELQEDKAVGAAEKELTNAQKIQKAAEDKLSIIRSTLELQNSQLQLVAQEANIVSSLNKELEKLRKKQKTDLELQLSFLKLMNEETKDLVAAAKAKFTLDSADSTELEKQEATLKLQEIAMKRIQRESEAVKLGFDPAILVALRDTAVVWDDLGIKDKADEFDDASTSIAEGILNLKKITEEWDATLLSVENRWIAIKKSFLETVTELNANLPSFLKILPEYPGGEPPILETLRKYKGLIIGIALAITGAKIITLITGVYSAFSILYGVIATILGSGVITAIAGALSAVAWPIAILIGAITLLSIAWHSNFLNIRDVTFIATQNIREDAQRLIETLITLKDAIVYAFTKPFSKEGREEIRAQWQKLRDELANPATRDDLLLDMAQQGTEMVHSLTSGALTVLNPLHPVLKGITEGALEQIKGDPLPKEIGIATVLGIGEGLETGDDLFSSWLSNMVSPVFAAEGGADLNALGFGVGESLGTGVSAGLLADVAAGEKAASELTVAMIQAMKDTGDIQSPSGVTRTEVGAELASGIIVGFDDYMERGLMQKALGSVLQKIIVVMKKWQPKAKAELNLLKIMFDERSKAISDATTTQFETMATDIVLKLEDGRTNIGVELDEWDTSMDTAVSAITKGIVGFFTIMGTDIITELGLINTNIAKALGDTKGGILRTVYETLFGTDKTASIPYTIGLTFAEELALGIAAGQADIRSALVTAFNVEFPPTPAGPASRSTVMDPFVPKSNVSTSNTSTVNRTNVFNLNVNSAATSQGVVADYGTMRAIATGTS